VVSETPTWIAPVQISCVPLRMMISVSIALYTFHNYINVNCKALRLQNPIKIRVLPFAYQAWGPRAYADLLTSQPTSIVNMLMSGT